MNLSKKITNQIAKSLNSMVTVCFVIATRQVVAKISDSEFRMAERAYHFIFYDEPEWFFQQVDRFLGLD
jgi:hypothetical protein